MAQAGIASRRKAEGLIRDGHVRVNGKIVSEQGIKVDPNRDKIEVYGRRISRAKRVYVLMHKPRQTVTTREDPEGRQTVIDLARSVEERVFPVGRLDYNTSGALLLTNDGELSEALSHPRAGVPRTYKVKITGRVTKEQLAQLMKGVDIGDGKPARAKDVFVVGATAKQTAVQMTIHEGRNHQIHRMMEAIGFRVSKLMRTSFAGLEVDDVPVGKWRRLSGKELGKLKRKYLKSHRSRARGAKSSSTDED